MTRQVALLRGVNLGGRRLIMSELCALAEGAGFTDVGTVVASGNLVLNSQLSGAKLEGALEALAREGLGLRTDVFVRDADDLDAIMAANPFQAFTRASPALMVVSFMRGPASRAAWAAMEASKSREEIRQGRDCLYIKYPDGQGRSKLKLPKLSTARNWNTVTKLAAAVRGE